MNLKLKTNNRGKIMYLGKLVHTIKQHEGLSLKPYRCSAGKLTIGYGRNIEDNGISKQEAEAMLSQDINETLDAICKRFNWFYALNEDRRIIIVDMVFNMGINRFSGFKKMIAALYEQNYTLASHEMLDSKWAEQVGQRAHELAEAMQTGTLK